METGGEGEGGVEDRCSVGREKSCIVEEGFAVL